MVAERRHARFSWTRSPEISACFLARVQRFSWRSRATAPGMEANASVHTSVTGRRRLVNSAPRPQLWTDSRDSGSCVEPT